jgi:hypothetical protein
VSEYIEVLFYITGMYTNSYIFGSSRGRSMSQVKCKQVNILPGGTYSKLCDLAEKQLRNNTDPKIVYFIVYDILFHVSNAQFYQKIFCGSSSF